MENLQCMRDKDGGQMAGGARGRRGHRRREGALRRHRHDGALREQGASEAPHQLPGR